MAHEFNTELTEQEEWGWLLAVDLFLGGMGGGLFLLFLIFNLSPSIAVLSLGLVALGAVVLMVELGRPLRAWRALCKPFFLDQPRRYLRDAFYCFRCAL